MKMTLLRRVFLEDRTLGTLSTDGLYFCDTLEDVNRDKNQDGDLNEPGEEKVYGETAIPYGIYDVILSYSNRFEKFLPLVTGVKGFTGIRIHGGNGPKDSFGCVLVGFKANTPTLVSGRETSRRLMDFLMTRCAEKDDAGNMIVIRDETYGKTYKLKEPITLQVIK